MNILVVLRMVPDVVEELELAPDGKSLDLEAVRTVLSESDDHALEQALLIKERHGGKVTVLALEAPDVDAALFAALAKGADRALKIVGSVEDIMTRELAHILARVIANEPGLLPAELILSGTQAINDLDGLIAPLLADELDLPFLGIVTGLDPEPSARVAKVVKEYPSGVRGEFEVALPAVFGIQAAEKPPRYVPVAKVRAAMKSQKVETVPMPPVEEADFSMIQVLEMTKPQVAGRAEMLEGSPQEVSSGLCAILAERGLL